MLWRRIASGWIAGLALGVVPALASSQSATPVPGHDYITARLAELRKIHAPEGIESLEPVSIDGTTQWVSIRGQNRANPVLLFVHGGPGTPNMPMSWAYQAPWEDFFTVVQWDQRGVGKNARSANRDSLAATMSSERLVRDAELMVQWVRKRLGKDKIVLMGYSYGTMLAMQVAARHPEWISVYVGTGQTSGSGDAWLYPKLLELATQRGDTQALRELQAIAPYPRPGAPIQDVLVTRKWARAFNGGWYGKPTFDLLFSLPEFAPEYTQADLEVQTAATQWTTRALVGKDPAPLALPAKLDVPVVILQGRNDLHTPYEPAKAYIERLQAPKKQFFTLERSAHVPFLEQPGVFLMHLVNSVLPLAGGRVEFAPPPVPFRVPQLDLSRDSSRLVVVDREPGQYLGHVTTTLLGDGSTMLAVYPKGHGQGAIVMKRSTDAGRSWSDRLPVPENWATSKEVPTIHRVPDPVKGGTRLILFSGLYPARIASSDDNGKTWSPLAPIGSWGGIVVMGSVVVMQDKSLLAFFHDDGRFFANAGKATGTFTLFQVRSRDGGRTWDTPRAIWQGDSIHLCEPGAVRSPDGKTVALLLRENRRRQESHVMFTTDEGATWSVPKPLARELTGDRHTVQVAKDGRLVVTFRDMAADSPTKGDWVAWVGQWADLVNATPGQYRLRLGDNTDGWDSSYPGLEQLKDGTLVGTTYGYWKAGELPYIVSTRFRLGETDSLMKRRNP
jgi:pimeloyl-ACP methyl ester carboxylesterase